MSVPVVALVVATGFSPFHFSVPCLVFGDILAHENRFELRICAASRGLISSGYGLSLDVQHGLEALDQADIIIVPYWHDPTALPDPALLEALVSAHQRGARLVGLCLGTYVLAYAGLLTNRRAATHWAFEQDFVTRFPHVRLDMNALYVEDERLITSAGTAAGLDCCLYIVRDYYGSAVANHVARRIVIPPYRDGGQAQFIEQPVPASTLDTRINHLLDYLHQHLSQPADLDVLAERAMMSRRTFTRHFHKATGMSVGTWLVRERLQHSQLLLESTQLSIEAIAELTGFRSVVTFRQHFRQRFMVSPRDWRKTFRGSTQPAHLAIAAAANTPVLHPPQSQQPR